MLTTLLILVPVAGALLRDAPGIELTHLDLAAPPERGWAALGSAHGYHVAIRTVCAWAPAMVPQRMAMTSHRACGARRHLCAHAAGGAGLLTPRAQSPYPCSMEAAAKAPDSPASLPPMSFPPSEAAA